MRKVKFLLNYKNSREIEFQRTNSQSADWRPARNIQVGLSLSTVPYEAISHAFKNEPFAREDLDTWLDNCQKNVAHRYEVIEKGLAVTYKKIPLFNPLDDCEDPEEVCYMPRALILSGDHD
jgi:hypothetical protein